MRQFTSMEHLRAVMAGDKDSVVAHYAAEEAKAAEEARTARNAAMWDHLMDVGLDGIREALDHCETVEDFKDYVYEAITDDTF